MFAVELLEGGSMMGFHKQLWIDATPADLRDRARAGAAAATPPALSRQVTRVVNERRVVVWQHTSDEPIPALQAWVDRCDWADDNVRSLITFDPARLLVVSYRRNDKGGLEWQREQPIYDVVDLEF